MKPLLFVLLAASLAANVVLGVLARRSALASGTSASPELSRSAAGAGASAAGAAAAPASQPSRSGGTFSGAGATTGAVWKTATTEQDLHRVVADLRSAGYPPEVVRAVVTQLLKERFAAREPNAGQPYWKHNNQTPEAVAKQAAVNQERRALFEALLGPDARPSALLDAETRLRRYGPMSAEKVDLLAKIETDYSEMSAEAWAKRRGNIASSSEAMMQTQQLMEQERQADMAAVLTPEELAEYERRNSPAARTLINNLRNLDITEAEYTRLYEAQKAFNAANPRRATPDQAAFAQRQTSQLALNEEVRAVLGEARFYSYLEGADYNYANAAKALTPFPSVTPAATYQAYRLQNELQAFVTQATREGRMNAEKTAELRTTVETYNTRLEALLGAEAAEAYRKQGSGRVFTTFRNVPRPGSSGG